MMKEIGFWEAIKLAWIDATTYYPKRDIEAERRLFKFLEIPMEEQNTEPIEEQSELNEYDNYNNDVFGFEGFAGELRDFFEGGWTRQFSI